MSLLIRRALIQQQSFGSHAVGVELLIVYSSSRVKLFIETSVYPSCYFSMPMHASIHLFDPFPYRDIKELYDIRAIDYSCSTEHNCYYSQFQTAHIIRAYYRNIYTSKYLYLICLLLPLSASSCLLLPLLSPCCSPPVIYVVSSVYSKYLLSPQLFISNQLYCCGTVPVAQSEGYDVRYERRLIMFIARSVNRVSLFHPFNYFVGM